MLPSIQELAQTVGPFAAFLVATFDRSGLPLIVGTVCVTVGIAQGSAPLTITLGTLGMITGDLVLYELGRRSGARMSFSKRLLSPLRPLKSSARAILRKYPSMSLIFGRYVAGAGIILPLLAGGFGMPRRRAFSLLIFGSIIYVVPWGILAFHLGKRFEPIVTKYSGETVWIALAALVGVVAWAAYQRVRRRARKAAALPQTNNDEDASI